MDHNDIRHKLSEFIDGAVTPGENAEIQQHLKTCTECVEALRELRKTIEHIHAVEDVESPAWMTQKIMAKVRAEQQATRGTWNRVFTPFLRQFPVQAVAVLFLVVTAYYMFSSINPAQKYTEEPVGMLAGKDAPAAKQMPEKDNAVREAAPEATHAPQKPGYKSLDMKYSYERPVPPVQQDRTVASPPAPAIRDAFVSAKEEARLEKRQMPPQAAAPSHVAEQAAPAAGAAFRQVEEKRAIASSASKARSAKDAGTIDLQKYIGRHESELASFSEVSSDKSDQGSSIIGSDHILLTRTIGGRPVLFFGKYLSPDEPGAKREAVITDAMVSPAAGESRNLVSWRCASNGQADVELMAVVDTSLRSERLPAIHAWRMNRKTGKFDAVDPMSISCVNEHYGQ